MASLIVIALSAAFTCANGKTFLASEPAAPPAAHLLEDLEKMLGAEHRSDVEARAARLEEVMRPTFLSMPKDADGTVAEDVVRYLLHRIFIDRHGWSVRGLDASGDTWNSSSPIEAMQNHVIAEVPEVFNKHFEGGATLHHTAVLAAMLESVIRGDTRFRLESAYRVASQSVDKNIETVADAMMVIDSYMVLYILGIDKHSTVSVPKAKKFVVETVEGSDVWRETAGWARSVAKSALFIAEIDGQDTGKKVAISYNEMLQAVEKMADAYGPWQNKQECSGIKGMLLDMERNGTGRVPLDAFYRSTINGGSHFTENVPYLRQLGALDETNPNAPSVMIANYINAPSNCVASSQLYSVCCIDECAPLLANLEHHLAAPHALPETIAELVSNLPSSTVQAPRELQPQLLQRLQEIADHHGGVVPLHGRLFALWLHHAYPRECPFPHLSGSTQPMTETEWKKETGEEATYTPDMLPEYVAELESRSKGAYDERANHSDLPWMLEEELYLKRSHVQLQERRAAAEERPGRAVLRLLSLMAAMISVGVMLVRSFLSVSDAVAPAYGFKSEKHMV